jgi:hypothetical protein
MSISGDNSSILHSFSLSSDLFAFPNLYPCIRSTASRPHLRKRFFLRQSQNVQQFIQSRRFHPPPPSQQSYIKPHPCNLLQQHSRLSMETITKGIVVSPTNASTTGVFPGTFTAKATPSNTTSGATGAARQPLGLGSNCVLTKDPSVKFSVCPWNRLNTCTESDALRATETEDGWLIYDAPNTAGIIVHH